MTNPGIIVPDMSMKPSGTGPADVLFGGTRRGCSRISSGSPAAASCERLLTVRTIGNQKHDRANARASIFAELRGIVQKTSGLADPLRDASAPLASKIAAAFVFGSVAEEVETSATRPR